MGKKMGVDLNLKVPGAALGAIGGGKMGLEVEWSLVSVAAATAPALPPAASASATAHHVTLRYVTLRACSMNPLPCVR